MKLNTITKAELIEALEDLNDNDLVAFSSDYGDYTHTQQVHELRGRIEAVDIEESAYSKSGFAVAEPDHDMNNEKQPDVYIIS